MANTEALKLYLINQISSLNDDATLTKLEKVLNTSGKVAVAKLKKRVEKKSYAGSKKVTTKASQSDITKLYGTLQLNMSIEEIDKQLNALRNEWERDIY